MICGAPLQYLDQARQMACTFCGRGEPGHIICPNGHYTCEHCHNRDAVKTIEAITAAATSQDPIEISETMMSHPVVPMLGCQHAYAACGAFMAALKNEGSRKISEADISEAFSRTAKQAHGGYCGLTGICGIAPALGACFAVLTGSRCGADREQKTAMEAVLRVATAIAGLTGPSCCKAYVRASLLESADVLRERFGIVLPVTRPAGCTFSDKHPLGCRREKCPYFAS